jgi:hypothetical protein
VSTMHILSTDRRQWLWNAKISKVITIARPHVHSSAREVKIAVKNLSETHWDLSTRKNP